MVKRTFKNSSGGLVLTSFIQLQLTCLKLHPIDQASSEIVFVTDERTWEQMPKQVKQLNVSKQPPLRLG